MPGQSSVRRRRNNRLIPWDAVCSAPRLPYPCSSAVQLRFVNPPLASLVDNVISFHVNKKTQSAYNSATRLFVRFCSANGLSPFPADATTISAWMVFQSHFISLSSLAYYLSGIRSSHLDRGIIWTLNEDPVVARTWRALKKLYTSSKKAKKFPISLTVLLKIFPLLPGWPTPASLSHNDRSFIAASLIGIFGFLRSGEFLYSKSSSRPILRGSDIKIVNDANFSFLEISIARPTARWWIAEEVARCFHCSNPLLDPVCWYQNYVRLSPVGLSPLLPAFRLDNGRILSRDWMVKKTSSLLILAAIVPLDNLGNSVSVKGSSWRAGGVRSAKDSGISDTTIMTQGRWSSIAWSAYDFTSLKDLHSASEVMQTCASSQQLEGLMVGL